LNLLFDEVPVTPEERALAPRYLSVALTNACDLRCSFCYAPKHAARLDTETLKAWLRELDANGCLGVGFGGGEPTLHPDFVALCRFAARETGLAVTFTTHAHHLDDKLIDRLRGYVHFVRVSLDGVGKTYEATRGRPFPQLLLRLEALRNTLPFGLNVVVNEQTVSDLDAVAAVAADYGAAELLLLPERATGTRPGVASDILTTLSVWVQRYTGRVPLTVSESAAASLAFFSAVPGETGLRAYAHVDATGLLKSSSFDLDGVRIGDEGLIASLSNLQQRFAHGAT
jgi:sulfatase maturation enzyme AslB (radical SAM superfamily)